MNAPIENIGLVNIIDKVFDEYKGTYTPYEIETNATVLSFIKKIYAIIKDGSVFNDEELLTTYKTAVDKVLLKLLQIENRKIYEYSIRVSADISAFDGFRTMINELWNYVYRDFPKTLTENEQKIGYYETKNGKTFFNGYREDVVIGDKSLTPTYKNEITEYTKEKNEYFIKMIGIIDGDPIIQLHVSDKTYNYLSIDSFIIGFRENVLSKIINVDGKDVSLFSKYYNSTDGGVTVKFYFAFENGFVVDNNNEYENPNGKIYELFEHIKKSLYDKSSDALIGYLKNYLYTGIVSRYREKKIEDKETSVHSEELNVGKDANVIPYVYEKLNGKGGKIGSLKTINFGTNKVSEETEYQRLIFDEAYYNVNTNKIEIYINKNYLNDNLKKLSSYTGITGDGSYLNFLKNKYDKLKYYPGFNIDTINYLNEEEEITENILKEMLFAVEPFFLPKDINLKKEWNKEFFINNILNFQKVYFYNNSSLLQEDNLLKNLSSVENNNLSYSKLKRERNISISFDKNNLIIYLNNDKDIVFDNKYSSKNEYFSSLKLDKIYIGSGYINLKKVPQKFKDNRVSKLVDNENTNKRENYESEEFGSLLDDREFVTVYTTKAFLADVSGKGLVNAEFNEEKQVWEEQKIPEYKKNCILYKKPHYYELDCSDFSEKNDINCITQIRVMSKKNNLHRFLFNVRKYDKTFTNYDFNYILSDIVEPLEYNLSNVLDEKIIIPETSINYPIKEEKISYTRSDFEMFKIDNENLTIKYLINDLDNKNYVTNLTIRNEAETIEPNTLILNNESSITIDKKVSDTGYTLYINDLIIQDNAKKYNYKLILEKNLYTEQYDQIIPESGMEVEILDFIQSNSSTNKNEFKYYDYAYTEDKKDVEEIDWKKPNKKLKPLYNIRKNLYTYFIVPEFIPMKINKLTFNRLNNFFTLEKKFENILFKKPLNLSIKDSLLLKDAFSKLKMFENVYAVSIKKETKEIGIKISDIECLLDKHKTDKLIYNSEELDKSIATEILSYNIEFEPQPYFAEQADFEESTHNLEIEHTTFSLTFELFENNY